MRRIIVEFEAVCAVCGCTETRACQDGCFWAIPPTRSRRGVCSNCVNCRKKPVTLAERFPKDHEVFWVRRHTSMGEIGDEAVVIGSSRKRVNIRVCAGASTHWVTPRRILDVSTPPVYESATARPEGKSAAIA
jgi:hypothetical protein